VSRAERRSCVRTKPSPLLPGLPQAGAKSEVPRPGEDAGAGIEVYLFGRVRVERGGRPLPNLTCAKARELLAFLLIHRDRPHRREAIADLLWGVDGHGDPRKTLRQALWRLNSVVCAAPPLFASQGEEWIQVGPDARIWLDVAAFESVWQEIEASPNRSLPGPALPKVRAALDLYRGELAEGSDWEWCHFERLRLRDLFFALSDAAMSSYLEAGDLTSGFHLGFEILRHDPAREKTHQRLMLLHALAGDRSAALRQFDRCVAALREELGVEPSRATCDLFEQIRDGREAIDRHSVAGTKQQELTSVLEGLRHLRMLLSEARREVHVKIEAIERAFGPQE
jgi:DNA-binding SARP family transcriptional activator